MAQDQGNRFVRESVGEAEGLILIHHWGAPRSVLVDGGAQGDHRIGHDITVPPFHGEQARLNRWMRTLGPQAIDLGALRQVPEPSSFARQLFFSGKMNLNWGRHYSLGVRQVCSLPPSHSISLHRTSLHLPVHQSDWGHHYSLRQAF